MSEFAVHGVVFDASDDRARELWRGATNHNLGVRTFWYGEEQRFAAAFYSPEPVVLDFRQEEQLRAAVVDACEARGIDPGVVELIGGLACSLKGLGQTTAYAPAYLERS